MNRYWALIVPFALFGIFPVFSQSLNAPAPPHVSAIDGNGYDDLSRSIEVHLSDLSIGGGILQLNHTMHGYGNKILPYDIRDNFVGQLQASGIQFYNTISAGSQEVSCNYDFSFDSHSDCFDLSNGNFVPRSKNGSLLVANTDGTYTYTSRDGSTYTVSGFMPVSATLLFGHMGVVTQAKYPNGLIVNINWKIIPILESYSSRGDFPMRIQSVTTNTGLQIKYSYASNVAPQAGSTFTAVGNWKTLTQITAISNAIDYCDPMADTCALAHNWKSSTYNWATNNVYIDPTGGLHSGSTMALTVTDQAGAQTRYTVFTGFTGQFESHGIIGIKPPSSSVDQYTFQYCAISNTTVFPFTTVCYYPTIGNYINTPQSATTNFIASGIASYTKEGRQYNFIVTSGTNGNGAGGSSYFQNVKVDPDGRRTTANGIRYSNPPWGNVPTSLWLATAEQVTYAGDTTNRIVGYTNGQPAPFNYTYDGRGNVTALTRTAATGSGLANIVRSAVYPTTCVNIVTCNKPTSVTDANGNTTSYTYDPNHGGVLTETLSAGANGIQPQKRYSYAQMSAYYLNASGALVASPNPVWVPTQESECKSGAASGSGCALAGDDIRKTYLYGAAGTVNNLLLHGVIEDSAPGGKALTTCYGYDVNGNKISQTQPRAGLTSCP